MKDHKEIKYNISGIKAFLESPFIKGIGKVYAQRIVDKYGEEILNPEFDLINSLKEIPGLTESKVKEIKESLDTLKVSPQILAMLYSARLSDTEVGKITDHYGKRLGKILEWDPYDMVENVWKLSFFTADKIGKWLNIPSDDPRRIRGAILTAIKFYAEEGNMYATESQIIQTVSRLTGVDPELITPEISNLIQEGRIKQYQDGIYLPPYYNAEKEAAEKLSKILHHTSEGNTSYVIPEKDLSGNTFSEMQKEAVSTVINNNITIITGGPGTGKTTTLRGIVDVMIQQNKKVILVAPTGRAAKRILTLTGNDAQTIHRLLGYSMGKGYKSKKLKADVLIIDESSMLEQVLFNHLLQALDDNTKIVLVGDTDQLPPIGAGVVLKDMIETGKIPVINLHENYRQTEGSDISHNAAAIREGKIPGEIPGNEFIFVEENNAKNIHSRLISLISEELPAYTGLSHEDFLIITPQQEGSLGAKQLNKEFQDILNPDAPEIKRGLKNFRLGDKVMQVMNSSERNIYNGEVGKVTSLDPVEKILEVTFNDGKKSLYKDTDFRELSLAYATTVHKMQGSETDNIVLIVSSAHKPLLYRNLIYTGVSRAKKLCIVVGESEALKTAVSTKDKNIRNSNFKSRLLEEI